MKNAQYYVEKAEKCRCFIILTKDPLVIEGLMSLVDEYEAKAKALGVKEALSSLSRSAELEGPNKL